MPPARADLVIRGRIASLGGDRGFGWVEALAVRSGRVAAAGPWAEVEPLSGRGMPIWRLGDDLVAIPGITDAHLHLQSAALAARQLDLGELTSRGAVLEAVARAHGERNGRGDADGWLLGHGWSIDAMGGWPHADLLAAAAPGRPVALWSHDHHARWLSPEALRRSGIGPRTPEAPGGRIMRDAAGVPTGILQEDAATLVDTSVPEPEGPDVEAALAEYTVRLLALGVTGCHDPGELVADAAMRRGPTLYRAMAAAGRLPLRVVGSIREAQLARALAAGFATGRPAGESGRYRDGWLKLFADGALGSRTAALLEPYEPDDPAGQAPGGSTGMLLRSADQLGASCRRAVAGGIAVQVHALGDAAVRLALDVLRELPRPASGACHRIEHAQLIATPDIGRFVALGVAASVQPCHLISDAEVARKAWGARTARAFPLADLAATGALTPYGTDAPVESPDPWPGIAAAVTRASGRWPGGRAAFHAEQSVALWRALRSACLDPARSLGLTDEGHLGAGARADLLVLATDCLDEPVRVGGALETTRPLATLIDGVAVHQDPAFDP